ncbi:GH3 auxin-responsive promoter family protein [Mesorhizobium sp. M0589]|uniref:GH3 family domain-containing protein n=1 Tax=Mesorhizobium sp. M0589 TaxID=2956965 RepID=UPI00333A0AAA
MVIDAWSRIADLTAATDAGFRAGLSGVETAQRGTLAGFISANGSTAFGKDRRFAEIRSAEAFRDLVPIADYAALQPYIGRAIGGEDGVLTTGPIRFIEQTGGSSGGSKNIPYTDTGLRSFTDCLYPWLADLIRRRPGVTRGRSYFALSPVGRSLDQRIGVHRVGSPVPFAYFGALRDSLIALSAVPMELRLLADFESWQRQTCLHLLACEDLALVWVWSPTYFTEILRAMRRDAGILLPQLTSMLTATHPAAAVRTRIETLEKALRDPQGDLSVIWPQLDTVSCWTDASSKGFAAELQALFPAAFIQSKGLMSTEAAVSFPYGDGPGSILAARSGFFEFVDDGGTSHFAWRLEIGQAYRLIVTTGSGLYRYDTQDMVKVVGFDGDTPRLQFVGRAGMVSDLCGEKLTEAFVAHCIGKIGLGQQQAYALVVAATEPHPHYRLFLEAGPAAAAWSEKLDAELAANPQYEYARRIGQLGPVQATPVEDLYGRLKRHRLKGGISIAGMKAPVLLRQADSELIAALDATGA